MTALALSREDEQLLVEQVEAFLASQPATPVERLLTAHPLLSRSTADLVAEVEGNLPPPPAPSLSAPPRLARLLPESLWRLVGAVRPRREVTVGQYLHLLVLVLERHGWTGAGARRTVGGCRCIAGSQELLAHLGYGSRQVAEEAGRAIQAELHRRGESRPYWEWNDTPGRTRGQVLALLLSAA